MAYWIFKVADQELYPDITGQTYVYDNTHSVRIQPGDIFLYLDKTANYSFTATGTVRKLDQRNPTHSEMERADAVRTVYTAHLSDVVWFTPPLSISGSKKIGRQNRALLGIIDVNKLGWSKSMSTIGEAAYHSILELAEAQDLIQAVTAPDYSIPDKWSETKIRPAIKGFSEPVLARSESSCIVCGCSLKALVEAAHLSPYATDIGNRANPANGVGLCKFCHRALDLRYIAIRPDGELMISPHVTDTIAHHHFSRISREQRLAWLRGVDQLFLQLTVKWHVEYLTNWQDAR